MVTRDDVETLLNVAADPAVSIFMPTNLPSLTVRQDGIHLKNQLDNARDRLEASGWTRAQTESLLAPARMLLNDDSFWREAALGLAIFLARGVEPRIWRLPQTVEELVVVGSRFHIAPLLPLFANQGRFLLLAVSSTRARLFTVERQGMEEIDCDLPQGVWETVRAHTDYQQSADSNPMSGKRSGQPSSVPADQVRGPSPEEQRKAELMQYLHKLGAQVARKIGSEALPILLAAQPELAGNLRAQTKLARLWPDHLNVNPDAVSLDALHGRAWAMMEAAFSGDREAAIDHFNSLYQDGSPRASVEPTEIVKAARWGKVDTLILAEGEHLWGHFDETANRIETHDRPEAHDDDLLDLAAQLTLLNGGDVKVVTRDHVPMGARAAGIMRY